MHWVGTQPLETAITPGLGTPGLEQVGLELGSISLEETLCAPCHPYKKLFSNLFCLKAKCALKTKYRVLASTSTVSFVRKEYWLTLLSMPHCWSHPTRTVLRSSQNMSLVGSMCSSGEINEWYWWFLSIVKMVVVIKCWIFQSLCKMSRSSAVSQSDGNCRRFLELFGFCTGLLQEVTRFQFSWNDLQSY